MKAGRCAKTSACHIRKIATRLGGAIEPLNSAIYRH
jgi:hypothetical protein